MINELGRFEMKKSITLASSGGRLAGLGDGGGRDAGLKNILPQDAVSGRALSTSGLAEQHDSGHF